MYIYIYIYTGCKIRSVRSSGTSCFRPQTSKSSPFYIVKSCSGLFVYNDGLPAS